MDDLIESYVNSEMDLEWQLDIWDEDKFNEEDLVE